MIGNIQTSKNYINADQQETYISVSIVFFLYLHLLYGHTTKFNITQKW